MKTTDEKSLDLQVSCSDGIVVLPSLLLILLPEELRLLPVKQCWSYLNSQDPEGRHRRGCQRHWRVLGGLTGFCGSCSPKHIYFSYYHVLFAGGGEHRRWGEAYPAGRCCPLLPPSMLHSGTPHPLLSTNRCSNVWLPVKVRLLLSHQYQPCSIMYKYFIKIRFLSVKRMYNFRCEPATWDWSKQRRERKNNNRREQCYWSIWYIISLGPPLDSV